MWIEPVIGPRSLEMWQLLQFCEDALTSEEMETKIWTEVQRWAKARMRCDHVGGISARQSGLCE